MMILSNALRYFLTFLSFPSNLKSEKLSEVQKTLIKDLKAKSEYLINSGIKNDKLNTHKIFSNSVLSLIRSGNLNNFLRRGFIQKMFFVHNRFYNYLFLKKIINSKSNFWNKLLEENDIGNPIPFFLYKKSSGNKIRQVYLLKEIFDFGKIKNVDSVFEIGGGYGSMGSIMYNINKEIEYTIFDLPEVNLLQYYYLKSQNIDCALSDLNKKINLVSEISSLKKKLEILKKKNKKVLIIANWSFSEMPISLRNELEFLFLESDFGIISFQSKFEEISNVDYFKNFFRKFENNFSLLKKPIVEMNNFLNSNKHYSILIKKN